MKNSKRLPDTKGRTIQFDRFEKGFNQANIDFDFLRPNNVRAFENKVGKLGSLSDGRNVNVRLDSTADRPTLEIQNKKNLFKFRY